MIFHFIIYQEALKCLLVVLYARKFDSELQMRVSDYDNFCSFSIKTYVVTVH